MLKVLVTVAALFPWTLVVAAVLSGLAKRRRLQRPSFKNTIAADWAPRPFTGERIERPMDGPILFDSTRIAKALRGGEL